MKAREARFIGNGNTWVGEGKYRGWSVTCCQCGAVKTITSHGHSSSLPPHVIAKKLLVSGWYIGHKPEEDICVACRSKKKKGNGDDHRPAPEIDAHELGEYVKQLQHALVLLKVANTSRQHERAGKLIEIALRGVARLYEVSHAHAEALAKRVIAAIEVPKPKPKLTPAIDPAPPIENTDYELWLKELDKDRDA